MMKTAIVGGFALLAVAGYGLSANAAGPPPPTPVPAVSTPAPASPSTVLMPDLVGLSAGAAVDRLKTLGFPWANVRLHPVDGHKFILLPQDWTVVKQSRVSGSKVPLDTVITLGCKKRN